MLVAALAAVEVGVVSRGVAATRERLPNCACGRQVATRTKSPNRSATPIAKFRKQPPPFFFFGSGTGVPSSGKAGSPFGGGWADDGWAVKAGRMIGPTPAEVTQRPWGRVPGRNSGRLSLQP